MLQVTRISAGDSGRYTGQFSDDAQIVFLPCDGVPRMNRDSKAMTGMNPMSSLLLFGKWM
jgi:hypothetical protein